MVASQNIRHHIRSPHLLLIFQQYGMHDRTSLPLITLGPIVYEDVCRLCSSPLSPQSVEPEAHWRDGPVQKEAFCLLLSKTFLKSSPTSSSSTSSSSAFPSSTSSSSTSGFPRQNNRSLERTSTARTPSRQQPLASDTRGLLYISLVNRFR